MLLINGCIRRVKEVTMNNNYILLWQKSRSTANGPDHGAGLLHFLDKRLTKLASDFRRTIKRINYVVET